MWDRQIKILIKLISSDSTLERSWDWFVVAAVVRVGGGLPMWAAGQASIYFAKIKIKNLIKFNKRVLSSTFPWFQTSLLRPIQINVSFKLKGNF